MERQYALNAIGQCVKNVLYAPLISMPNRVQYEIAKEQGDFAGRRWHSREI